MDRRLNPIAATLLAAFAMPVALQQSACAQTAQASETALPEVTVRDSAEAPYKTEKAASPKFTAPLLETPKSITVIPAEVIQQTGATSLVEALRTTPGITFGAGEGGNPIGDRPFIRGYDAGANTFVDGVRDTGSQTREIFDIEAVEVVKGSDGAFGGRGAAGGSVNLITKAPKKENFSSANIGVGTDNYKRAAVDGNYLLGDNAAIRLNAMVHDANVPGRGQVDVSRWGFAPSLKLGLNSPTSVILSYYHMQSDDLPDYSTPYKNSGAGRTKANPDAPVNVGRQFYGLTGRDFRKTQADIGTVQVQHDFGDSLVFSNTTRYGRSTNNYIVTNPDDSAGNVANGKLWRSSKNRDASTETATNQANLSGKFATGSVKHSFSTGLEISREQTSVGGYALLPASGVSGRPCNTAAFASGDCTSLNNPNPSDKWSGTILRSPTVTQTTTNTRSVYAFDTLELSKQWLANLGLRYDSYSTTASTPAYIRTVPNGNGQGANAVGATVPGVTVKNDANFWNYQAALIYKLTPDASVYGSYSTASTPSGVSTGDGSDNISAANQNLAPERSHTYEIGTKWDVLHKKLSLTAAVFRTEKNNARVPIDANTVATAGKQKVDGLELGIAGNLTDKWQVFGGYTYLDSALVDNGSFGTNAANNGNQFPNTAKNSFSLWSTYQVLPKLTVGGGAFYMSHVFGNAANTLYVPSYTRFDAMASYVLNRHVTLQLNVQNLTNKLYYDQGYAAHYAHQAPARSAVLSANLVF
ncbi:TonB-dependent receptor [Paraherbaspirillum soli]|uniref:TonB-dependent receptor n=1 Tax=Paraherbaspirillum soli TaxID=631222 RepID=A0ABW0MH52_9BURK